MFQFKPITMELDGQPAIGWGIVEVYGDQKDIITAIVIRKALIGDFGAATDQISTIHDMIHTHGRNFFRECAYAHLYLKDGIWHMMGFQAEPEINTKSPEFLELQSWAELRNFLSYLFNYGKDLMVLG